MTEQSSDPPKSCALPLENVEFSRKARSVPDRMRKARHVVAEPVVGAAEREVVPRNVRRIEGSRLQTLIVAAQPSADRGCGVHDDDGGASRVGVDVHEAIETNVEATF